MTADGYIDTGLKMKVADIAIDTSLTEPSLTANGESLTVSSGANYTFTTSLSGLSQRVTQLEDLVAIMVRTNTLATSSGLLTINYQPLTITGSYMDNELAIKTATNLTYDASTNTTHVLGSATVGGDLTIGLLTINDLDASINSMGESLKLQSLALNNIELMAGKIVIDTQGDIKVEGNIEAQTVAVQEFKVTGTKSAGSAILRAGDLTLTVSTDVITPESRVFTQVISTPENAGTVQDNAGISLVVIKLLGTGLEVRPAIPAGTDIFFDWFIIGGTQ